MHYVDIVCHLIWVSLSEPFSVLYINFCFCTPDWIIFLAFSLVIVPLILSSNYFEMILVQSFSQHWFFIMSKLGNNLVMDVAYCRTTPGTQVISYTKKNPPRPNQLWRKEYIPNGNTFYLVSKLHFSCRIAVKVINLCSYAAYLWLTSWFYIFL